MKWSLVAGLAFAGTAFAADPYPFILTQKQANTIVAKYKSVLENQTYNGQTPAVTAAQVVAPDYHEYSDSVQSLISSNSTLGVQVPTATTEQEWYNGVIAHPDTGIITHNIYVADKNKVLWYWTFPNVGIRKYPVTGFNLLRIDCNLQIYEADIEFNSIAWGVDTFEIQQYCGPPPSKN